MREVYHARRLARRLLKTEGKATRERAVGAIDKVSVLEIENGWTSAFANGFTDGQAARDGNQSLRAYVRVGIDDYAKGFRQGFFNRTTAGFRGSRQTPRQVARL